MTAKTLLLAGELLVCVLGGVYTDLEKTMIELQRAPIVHETRSAFQNAMEHRFIAALIPKLAILWGIGSVLLVVGVIPKHEAWRAAAGEFALATSPLRASRPRLMSGRGGVKRVVLANGPARSACPESTAPNRHA